MLWSNILVPPQIRGPLSISHVLMNGDLSSESDRTTPLMAILTMPWNSSGSLVLRVAGVQVCVDRNSAKYSPTRTGSCLVGVDIAIYPEFINVILHSSIWSTCADRLVRFPWTALTSSRPRRGGLTDTKFATLYRVASRGAVGYLASLCRTAIFVPVVRCKAR